MAERLWLGEYDQLHHFIAAGAWDAAPVETKLLVQADTRGARAIVDEELWNAVQAKLSGNVLRQARCSPIYPNGWHRPCSRCISWSPLQSLWKSTVHGPVAPFLLGKDGPI
jgi:hypothetical protein